MSKQLIVLITVIIFAVTALMAQKGEAIKDTTHPYYIDFSNIKYAPEKAAATTEGVTIGRQLWAPDNLDVTRFKNGDAIPEAKTKEEWKQAYEQKKPVWCYYNNDPANGTKYGRLYNLYAVTDKRGLAPAGWHIPTKEECETMMKLIAPELEFKKGETAGKAQGFLLGGFRGDDGFTKSGEAGAWWSSSFEVQYGFFDGSAEDGAYGFSAWDNYVRFSTSGAYTDEGLSVRCVKD